MEHTSKPIFSPRTDPITFEVLRHRLWQINDEQGRTIINVSGSPVASEGNDFNVAVADADGELIAVGPYIVMHVTALTLVIRNTMQLLGEDNIVEGDMYLINDPWMGAAHQNDICIVQPVFWQGRRIAWTASVIHHVDVGGPAPGSWNFAARTTFEEAPRYKALRVVRDGVVQPEVIATVMTNSRLPDLIELDLRAQIAAANVARERLVALIQRYGIATVTDVIEDMLDYAQSLFRRKLLELPDGEWYSEDHIDHDGHEERTYTVRCHLRKTGDRLLFDFRGTSKQAPGLINTPYAGAISGANCAVFPLLCENIPWNSGVLRQVDIEVEPGTVHDATFPAPVGYGVVHASWTTLNVSALALGKMLASSGRHHRDAMAGWAGSTFVYNIFARDRRGNQIATMLLSSDLQGCGARAFGDGYDVGGKLNAPRGKVTNIESAENEFPLLYLYRRRLIDSGGAGTWRGGVSAEVAFIAHEADNISLTANTVGVNHSSSMGLCGGYPGGNSTVALMRDSGLAAAWACNCAPQQLSELDGKIEMLPAKQIINLRPGDVFLAAPHGGGGFGDPLEREPRRVADDVREKLVSRVAARDVYGVVVDEDGRLRTEETAHQRSAIRRARRQTSIAPPLPVFVCEPLPVEPPNSRLAAFLVDGEVIYCASCRCGICRMGSPVKDHLLFKRGPLGDGGPGLARRWGGDSPTVELWEYFCPHCAALCDVEQHLKSDDASWNDVVISEVASWPVSLRLGAASAKPAGSGRSAKN
jgi:N-methylhydantoinase B